MILRKGIAFLSLIYMQGHVMLYAGELEGKAMAMHNVWGIKTNQNGKDGRTIVGKAIVSDLIPWRKSKQYKKRGSSYLKSKRFSHTTRYACICLS